MTKFPIIASIILASSFALAQEAQPVASPVQAPDALSSKGTTDQPHHLISVSTEGLGWSGVGTVFNWDKDESGIKNHELSKGEIDLNYSYIFPTKFMIGLEVSSATSKEEIKDTAGDKTTEDSKSVEFGLTAGYNFNDDLYNSWWVKGTIGRGDYESETEDSSGKTDFEYDYTYWMLAAGKRFSFDSLGLRNLSYSPAITVGSAKVSGDAEDAGLETITQVRFDIIKFDILF